MSLRTCVSLTVRLSSRVSAAGFRLSKNILMALIKLVQKPKIWKQCTYWRQMQPAVNHEKHGAPPSGNLSKKLECRYFFCCPLVGIAIDYRLTEGFTALSRRAECPDEVRNPTNEVGFEQ